jgi:hypothetical protein
MSNPAANNETAANEQADLNASAADRLEPNAEQLAESPAEIRHLDAIDLVL